MKRALLSLGLLLMVVTVIGWIALGANSGWTKTSVPVRTLDEITGIEAIEYQEKFLPGVEMLAGGVFAGAVLVVLSLFIKPKQSRTKL